MAPSRGAGPTSNATELTDALPSGAGARIFLSERPCLKSVAHPLPCMRTDLLATDTRGWLAPGVWYCLACCRWYQSIVISVDRCRHGRFVVAAVVGVVIDVLVLASFALLVFRIVLLSVCC